MEVIAAVESRSSWRSLMTLLWTRARTALAGVKVQRRQHRLRLCESLSLGDKSRIAVVEYNNQRLLIAVTSHNISLLQSLGSVSTDEKEPLFRA